MRTCLSGFLFFLSLLAARAPAAADEPADLAALLRQADSRSPALLAGAARLESARHARHATGAPADPEISLAYVNDGARSFTLGESDMTTLGLTWTQEVRYPGKRSGASEVAASAEKVEERSLTRARLDARAAVLAGWADLYRIDRTTALLQESRALVANLAEAARRRYETGQGSQEGVLRAQSEVLRLDAEGLRVRVERSTAALRLNAAVGRASDARIALVSELPGATLPGDASPLVGEALGSSAELAFLGAAAEREEASARVARLETRPDFVWSATYMNRGGLDPMLGAMFGVRLPLYGDRKQGAEALRRESEAVAARLDLEAARRRIEAQTREQVERALSADRLIALFEGGLIPQARAAWESARASYTVGSMGLAEVLEDAKTLLAARVDLAAREAERLQALAALENLLGRRFIAAEPSAEPGPAAEAEPARPAHEGGNR